MFKAAYCVTTIWILCYFDQILENNFIQLKFYNIRKTRKVLKIETETIK